MKKTAISLLIVPLPKIFILFFSGLLLLVAMSVPGKAQDNRHADPYKDYKHIVTMPIFGEVFAMSYPRGFVPASQETKGMLYRNKMIPQGETLGNSTQLVTVTGIHAPKANEEATPSNIARKIATLYKQDCPSTFNASYLKNLDTIEGREAFAIIIGCGALGKDKKTHSETSLLIFLKGEKNHYIITWSEKGEVSLSPVAHDKEKWKARFKTLMPIILCPVLPGEGVPYPSCIAKMPARK